MPKCIVKFNTHADFKKGIFSAFEKILSIPGFDFLQKSPFEPHVTVARLKSNNSADFKRNAPLIIELIKYIESLENYPVVMHLSDIEITDKGWLMCTFSQKTGSETMDISQMPTTISGIVDKHNEINQGNIQKDPYMDQKFLPHVSLGKVDPARINEAKKILEEQKSEVLNILNQALPYLVLKRISIDKNDKEIFSYNLFDDFSLIAKALTPSKRIKFNEDITMLRKARRILAKAIQHGKYVPTDPSTHIITQMRCLISAMGQLHTAAAEIRKFEKIEKSFEKIEKSKEAWIKSLPIFERIYHNVVNALSITGVSALKSQCHEIHLELLRAKRDLSKLSISSEQDPSKTITKLKEDEEKFLKLHDGLIGLFLQAVHEIAKFAHDLALNLKASYHAVPEYGKGLVGTPALMLGKGVRYVSNALSNKNIDTKQKDKPKPGDKRPGPTP
jgi:2'-5' RNA ligase